MILLDVLRQSLTRSPQEDREGPPAIVYGRQTFRRRALAFRAEQLRRHLTSVQTGERVAVLLPNHPDFVTSWLAVLARGAILVPLNPLYTPTELAELLQSARPTRLLASHETAGLAIAALSRLSLTESLPGLLILEETEPEPDLARIRASLLAGLPEPKSAEQLDAWLARADAGSVPSLQVERLCLPGVEADLEADPSTNDGPACLLDAVEVAPHTPAVILFTSGTTGAPKGAVLTHQNLGSNALFIAREWFAGTPTGPLASASPTRLLCALPLCHNFGLNVSVDAVLLSGGTMVLVPRFSAVEAIRALRLHRVTAAAWVPTMVQAVLTNPELSRWLDATPSESTSAPQDFRLLISGGAALPGALREAVSKRFPGLVVRDTYGLSEASLVACTHPAGQTGAAQGKPGTVGRPVGQTRVRILREDGQEAPAGEVGEIQVMGPGVMPGYWQQPYDFSSYWLTTGDLGFVDEDGDLTVVERKKDLIIHGGYKVYPLEVEAVLYQHPAVLEAAVFGVPDRRMGEKVVAVVSVRPEAVLPTGGEAPSALVSQLLAHCRQHLAEFKMPSTLEVRETLPRGSTGKILRRLLREGWRSVGPP